VSSGNLHNSLFKSLAHDASANDNDIIAWSDDALPCHQRILETPLSIGKVAVHAILLGVHLPAGNLSFIITQKTRFWV